MRYAAAPGWERLFCRLNRLFRQPAVARRMAAKEGVQQRCLHPFAPFCNHDHG